MVDLEYTPVEEIDKVPDISYLFFLLQYEWLTFYDSIMPHYVQGSTLENSNLSHIANINCFSSPTSSETTKNAL